MSESIAGRPNVRLAGNARLDKNAWGSLGFQIPCGNARLDNIVGGSSGLQISCGNARLENNVVGFLVCKYLRQTLAVIRLRYLEVFGGSFSFFCYIFGRRDLAKSSPKLLWARNASNEVKI